MQIRDEYACVMAVRGGPKDGQFPTPGISWATLQDALDQRVRMTHAGHRLDELSIVRRTVTYSEWEVVPNPGHPQASSH